MPVLPARKLTQKDVRELEDALMVAQIACARIQNIVPYASNLYDAGGAVIRACKEMEKEACSAARS
jgi:hypothetical protein